jgi:hypothetical protein
MSDYAPNDYEDDEPHPHRTTGDDEVRYAEEEEDQEP